MWCSDALSVRVSNTFGKSAGKTSLKSDKIVLGVDPLGRLVYGFSPELLAHSIPPPCYALQQGGN